MKKKPVFKPIVGEQFNNWTVISTDVKIIHRARYFETRCKCGNVAFKHAADLRSGRLQGYCNKCKYHPKYKGIGDLSGKYFRKLVLGCKRASQQIEFNVTIEYLAELLEKQDHKCALSGLPITVTRNNKEKTASVDRIDSTKGYIEGNVQWVHKDVNLMKNVLSQEYFIEMCRRVAQAPYETITKERYLEMKEKCIPITSIDIKEESFELQDCTGGACPIK